MRQPVRTSGAGPPPVATYLLILAQIAVWYTVRQYLLGGNAWTSLALRPGTPGAVRLFVSPFVHLDPAHLGVNMIVLWLLGSHLERAAGTVRFVFLYLGSAWFAALMQWAVFTSLQVAPDLSASNAAVGASGAIAGILAAAVVRFPMARLGFPFLGRISFSPAPVAVFWLVYTVTRAVTATMTGVTDGVGHWAHFAGFIFGLAAAQLMGLHRTARQEYLEHAARAATVNDDLVTAARAWAALLAMRPSDASVRASLVATRAALGDLRGARRLAREGLQWLVRTGERAAAVQAYRELTELLPDLDLPPGVRFRVGCWMADAGQLEGAFTALWESVAEEGTPSAAAGALHRAGQLAWERLRSPAHARCAWERLLEQFPDSPQSDAARDGLRRIAAAS